MVDALDRIEPERARFLARFAYLLGRVANADRQITPDETRTMERLLVAQGGLDADQAVLVVALAKSSTRMFGGVANFEVARDFSASASYDEKLALTRCLFAVAATDARISMDEEAELHRIAGELHIAAPDLIQIRLEHRRYLPGLAGGETTKPE